MITIIIIIIILISSAHRLNLSFHIARVLFTFICLHPTNHPTSSSQSTVYSSSLVVYIYASFNLIAIVKLHYNSGIAIVINTATIIKIFIVSSSSSSSSIVISGVAGIVAADTRYSFPLWKAIHLQPLTVSRSLSLSISLSCSVFYFRSESILVRTQQAFTYNSLNYFPSKCMYIYL